MSLISDGIKREFQQFGKRKAADKLLTIFEFNESGSSKICYYLHGRFERNKFGKIIYLSDSTAVLPYEISIFRYPYVDYRLYLRRIDLHLDKQQGSEIRITKPLITIFEE